MAQIFENLRKQVDPKIREEREKALNERVHAQYEKAQKRLSELVSFSGQLLSTEAWDVSWGHNVDPLVQIDTNSTLPCTISSIRVLNANHTRTGFLKRLCDPLLSANQDRPYTFAEALREVSITVDKLHRFGMLSCRSRNCMEISS